MLLSALLCAQDCRVIILSGTEKPLALTVILNGALCVCAYIHAGSYSGTESQIEKKIVPNIMELTNVSKEGK